MKYVECYGCERHVPITYTKSRTVEVESGRSSGAFTYKGWGTSGGWTGSQKKFRKVGGGLNYTEGRTYYRRVKVYYCFDCLKKEQLAIAKARARSKRNWKIFWSVIFIVGVYVWMQQ